MNKPQGQNIQHKEYAQQYYNNFGWGLTDSRLIMVLICMWMLNHYVVHLKLTQHGVSTIPQVKKERKKKGNKGQKKTMSIDF